MASTTKDFPALYGTGVEVVFDGERGHLFPATLADIAEGSKAPERSRP